MDREALVSLIFDAAAGSVPDGDDETWRGETEDGDEIYTPTTLADFLENTYLGWIEQDRYKAHGPKYVRAAAESVADVLIAAGIAKVDTEVRDG